jgi:hypothetical protein
MAADDNGRKVMTISHMVQTGEQKNVLTIDENRFGFIKISLAKF